MYQCYYQSDKEDEKTRCQERQEDYWCSEEHKSAWQKINYSDGRTRGQRQLTPKELQIGLLNIQIRELRKKWKQAEDMFEKAEIEERAKIIKEKRAILLL